jgi:hypothetical protein
MRLTQAVANRVPHQTLTHTHSRVLDGLSAPDKHQFQRQGRERLRHLPGTEWSAADLLVLPSTP